MEPAITGHEVRPPRRRPARAQLAVGTAHPARHPGPLAEVYADPPRVQHRPLPQPQAVDQAIPGGHQAGPGTARVRPARPARRQRDDGNRYAQPPHPAGRPTTGVWCHPECSAPWIITCGTSPTSGPHCATTTSRNAGSSAGTPAGYEMAGRLVSDMPGRKRLAES